MTPTVNLQMTNTLISRVIMFHQEKKNNIELSQAAPPFIQREASLTGTAHENFSVTAR